MAGFPYPENDPYSSDEEAQIDWDRVIVFIERGEDEKAIPILLRLWENDYPGAAHEIAKAKERLADLSMADLLEVETWYQRAADSTEDLGAQFNLARTILRRREIDMQSVSAERLNMAINILIDISRKDYPGADIFLALEYISGNNIHKNLNDADYLFKKAAKHKYVIALSMLRYINFKKGKYFTAIKYWIKSSAYLIFFLLSNPKDERLLGVFSKKKHPRSD